MDRPVLLRRWEWAVDLRMADFFICGAFTGVIVFMFIVWG